ncbi:MAG: patatin-like phospholipase family protein [Phycisphaerales bacterium]|nr:patatin-like phospholipase family protein [Phycisphaerales bacterium]
MNCLNSMRAALIAGLALSLASLALSGCSGQQRVLDDAKLKEMAAADEVKFREEFRAGVHRLMERVASRMDQPGVNDQTIDILAISGGGDYGAFGTGFLVGWGAAPGEFKRPDFDCVTGVSTGALISPFAYVGTDESYKTVENFYRNPKSDWVSMHEPFFFLPWNPSFATIPGLHRDLSGVIDQKFVDQMAAQSEKGKLLLVSASNLDLSRQRYWHMGPYAVEGAKTGDLDPIHKRLLASSAIPVVFPPVEIDGFLYADGGVTANVLVRLQPHSPDGFIQMWRKKYPGRPFPRVRFWVIFNNWMQPPASAVQQRWTEVMSPALAMSTRSGTIAEIRWLAAEAMYVNSQFGANIEVRVVSVPNDWRAPVKGDFKPETMNALADLGERMGADPASWQLWCSKAMADTTEAEAGLVEEKSN